MGGFAGGDEAGYWEIETAPLSSSQTSDRAKPPIEQDDEGYTIRAYARIEVPNSNLWIRSDELFNTIRFIPSSCETFTLEDYPEPLESHPIYQAYQALEHATNDPEIADFFAHHKVIVIKGIPDEKTFGGSSSDAAAFIHLTKEACNLILSTDELAKIGSSIAPELPFFIYNYAQAIVSYSDGIISILPTPR